MNDEQNSENEQQKPEGEQPQEEQQPEAPETEEQPAAPETPDTPQAPEAPEAPKTEQQPPAPKAPDAPKAPEAAPGAELDPIAIPEGREPSAEEKARREAEAEERARAEQAATAEPVEEPAAAVEPTELAKDARYSATGKRKSSVARVIVKPGGGAIEVNGRKLDEFFPRPYLQTVAKQPLTQTGYEGTVDVQIRVHGGGIAGQASAVRHGIARALTEIDPSLRGELKKRGMLTRDARVKERRKAGLKKARKKPQFSKR